MLFQNNFQKGDLREETHLSCQPYYSTIDMPCPLHCHSYYEISYIFQGERFQECNGKWYRLGDHTLLLIPPLYTHGYTNIKDTDDTVIQFTQEFLNHISPTMSDGNVLDISWKHPYIELDLDYMEELRALSIRKNEIKHSEINAALEQEFLLLELQINGLIMTLFTELINSGYLHIKQREIDDHDSRMFDTLINDILMHPDDIPNMEMAAQKSGLSYYNFSRHFKAATGFNYSEYCNTLKLQHAENLLINTTMPVSDVAVSIGITTFSYFSRLFKNKNGISPRAYRQQYRGISRFHQNKPRH